jgi:hypothetical protein
MVILLLFITLNKCASLQQSQISSSSDDQEHNNGSLSPTREMPPMVSST